MVDAGIGAQLEVPRPLRSCKISLLNICRWFISLAIELNESRDLYHGSIDSSCQSWYGSLTPAQYSLYFDWSLASTSTHRPCYRFGCGKERAYLQSLSDWSEDSQGFILKLTWPRNPFNNLLRPPQLWSYSSRKKTVLCGCARVIELWI